LSTIGLSVNFVCPRSRSACAEKLVPRRMEKRRFWANPARWWRSDLRPGRQNAKA